MENTKRSKGRAVSDELFYFIEAHDDDSAPDGAWWQMLEDAVYLWNEEHGTSYDENDTAHAYLRWTEDNGKRN